jgi:2-dehydro-3-deoxyphosphooctonate aldolase (KDO 8-P synthase)
MRLAGFEVGASDPLFLIAGPCVIESEALVMSTAERLKAITAGLQVPFVFKASFDKANRSSAGSFRGPGLERGLRILERVRSELEVPVLTDVHEDTPLDEVAAVVDVLQTPALLCRQTDFIIAVAGRGKPVNLKKGQFLAPWEMANVVDMRSLAILRATRCPVVFDATHAVQQPGARGTSSGGEREHVPVLARAAVAAGVAGLFMETHPDPAAALCDGPNAWPLAIVAALLEQLKEIDAIVKARPYLEDEFQRVH